MLLISTFFRYDHFRSVLAGSRELVPKEGDFTLWAWTYCGGKSTSSNFYLKEVPVLDNELMTNIRPYEICRFWCKML